MRLAFAGLLCSAAVWAQPAQPARVARIEGRVVALGGEPIARASVKLEGPGAPLTRLTNAEGRFVLDAIPPGREYKLTAERTGFLTGRYGARTPWAEAMPLTLDSGSVLRDVVVELTPQGVISGRILNSDGDPIRNVHVSALRPSYLKGKRRPEEAAKDSTNDQGEYRISNLAPGRYYVMASDNENDAPVAVEGATEPPLSNIPTYYPNTAEFRGASAITVGAGAEVRGIDVRLQGARTFAVRGRVVSSGGPVAGLGLSVLPKNLEETNGTINFAFKGTGSDGSFDLGRLRPGTYVIRSEALFMFRPDAPRLAARLEVTVTDKDLTGIEVIAGPGTAVGGRLRLEDGDVREIVGNPAAAAFEAAKIGGFGGLVMVGLVDADVPGFTPPAVVQAEGGFQIEYAAPSRYYLSLQGLPESVYIKSARFGSQDVLRAPVDLSSGGGGFDIVLSKKVSDITGIVRNDRGEVLRGVTVALWPKAAIGGREDQRIVTRTTDQNGGFQFAGLAPGDYFVAAWADVDPRLLGSFEFLEQFNTSATELKLDEGSHQALEAKVIPAEKVREAEEKLP